MFGANCLMQRYYTFARGSAIDTLVWVEVLFWITEKKCGGLLEQVHFASAGDGFSAPVYLQFFENSAVVTFDRIQGEEQALANFMI